MSCSSFFVLGSSFLGRRPDDASKWAREDGFDKLTASARPTEVWTAGATRVDVSVEGCGRSRRERSTARWGERTCEPNSESCKDDHRVFQQVMDVCRESRGFGESKRVPNPTHTPNRNRKSATRIGSRITIRTIGEERHLA